MSIIEKLKLVVQYTFSSFLSIELFLLCLLFFCFLVFNYKKRNKIVSIGMVGIFFGFLIGLLLFNSSYVTYCIDKGLKLILNYIYFPSTVVYFFLFVVVTIGMIWTIFSKKISKFKKIFNYFIFSVLYFFFFSFVALASQYGISLADPVQLYQKDLILAIVQISNFIFVFWLVVTFFYQLFYLFQRRYDSKKEIETL